MGNHRLAVSPAPNRQNRNLNDRDDGITEIKPNVVSICQARIFKMEPKSSELKAWIVIGCTLN